MRIFDGGLQNLRMRRRQRLCDHLDAVNRAEEAVTHMRRALQMDPASFLMNRHLGSTLFFARHYDEALHYVVHIGVEPRQSFLLVDQ
jgi:predicted YcjX-like family ATPase